MCVSIKLASERECMYDACVRACVYMQCAICGVSKIARWAGSESCGVIHRQARRSAARLHSRGDTRTALLSSGQLHLGSLAVHVEDVVRIGRRLCSCATAVPVSLLHSLNEAERHSRVRGASRQAGTRTLEGRASSSSSQQSTESRVLAVVRKQLEAAVVRQRVRESLEERHDGDVGERQAVAHEVLAVLAAESLDLGLERLQRSAIHNQPSEQVSEWHDDDVEGFATCGMVIGV